ncbi:MAG: hypothetical protein JRF22_01165 [Deltaproteobacteria bacterium]|nr:hypothetical protein [Deltaproteobacteria bacterium]
MAAIFYLYSLLTIHHIYKHPSSIFALIATRNMGVINPAIPKKISQSAV